MLRPKSLFNAPSLDYPLGTIVEFRARQEERLNMIRRLGEIKDEIHTSNDTLNAYKNTLRALEFSVETYQFFGTIAKNVALKLYDTRKDPNAPILSKEDYIGANSLYEDVQMLFYLELSRLSSRFLPTRLVFKKNAGSHGWANTLTRRCFEKAIAQKDKHQIGFDADYEENRRFETRTLNTLMHELTHVAVNQIGILVRTSYLTAGEHIDANIAADLASHHVFMENGYYITPNKEKILYYTGPNERLAYVTGSIFEAWLRILHLCDVHNIQPEQQNIADRIFEFLLPHYLNTAENSGAWVSAESYTQSKQALINFYKFMHKEKLDLQQKMASFTGRTSSEESFYPLNPR